MHLIKVILINLTSHRNYKIIVLYDKKHKKIHKFTYSNNIVKCKQGNVKSANKEINIVLEIILSNSK